jgi:hypothetical protein
MKYEWPNHARACVKTIYRQTSRRQATRDGGSSSASRSKSFDPAGLSWSLGNFADIVV